MGQTTLQIENEMDRFVDYCEKLAPGFATRIQGASAAVLERLAEFANLKLPSEYSAFLRRMGATPPGSLEPFLADVHWGVEAVQEFYQAPPIPVPRDAVYLSTLNVDFEMFLMLEGDDGGHPVVNFSWPVDEETGKFLGHERLVNPVASSLFQLLYKEAFLRQRNPRLAHHVELQERLETSHKQAPNYRAVRRREFQKLAERLGFRPVPYMETDDLLFYDRPDASLMLYANEVAADGVYVGAADAREMGRLRELFCDHLDLLIWE